MNVCEQPRRRSDCTSVQSGQRLAVRSLESEKDKLTTFKRGSCMVWEINIGVCPRLNFDNIMLFNCLGYNFNIYGAFEFLCNSIADL